MNRKPTESEKKKTKSIVIGIAEELGLTLANPEDVSYDEAIACGIAKLTELNVFEYKKK